MLTASVKNSIRAYLEEDIHNQGRNIYFNQYHSAKRIGEETVSEIVSRLSSSNRPDQIPEVDSAYYIRINQSPIFFWEVHPERWLVVYGSSLDRRDRNKLSELESKVGWLLKIHFQTDVIDEVYHEFSPDDEKVNIEKQWDPYWLYERDSDVPDHLQSYYTENINQFVQQEIEFNLKTPKWMVDEALEEGVRSELLEKSGISMSRFTCSPPNLTIAQDGGSKPQETSAKVSVRQGGQVVHRTGDLDATFRLIETLYSRNDLYDEFNGVVPEREYTSNEEGHVDITSYSRGKILKVTFTSKSYNEESSLKLSNLLTVGQNDVRVHGIIKSRGNLGFYCESRTPYDNGVIDILLTSEYADNDRRPSLYLKPKSGKTSGLLYVFHKLREKFDPRISYSFVDDFPLSNLSQESTPQTEGI